MENKENMVSRPLKRRSVMDIDDFFHTKRSTTHSKDSISENDISISSIESYCHTPNIYQENSHSSCLTEPFKVGINLVHTPKEQIVSLADFFKLPKPDIIKSVEPMKDLKFERSLTSEISESSLNDSFEIIRSQLYRSQTYNPQCLGLNNTPETPCDLHDIDIDNMGSICSLSRNSLIDYQFSTTFRKMPTNRIVQISPICYETEMQMKRMNNPLRKTQSARPSTSEPIFVDQEINRITDITADLVSEIIENDFTSKSFVYHIIDCRYPYEFDGGHINGAVNLYTPYQMLNYVFLSNYNSQEISKPIVNPEESLSNLMKNILSFDRPQSHWKHKAFIFHCEFSSIRGPEMARILRNMDRWANSTNYPQLYFPRIFIMTKGYKEFFSKYKNLCKPMNYVKMDITDPNREKGECMMGESDDEDGVDTGLDILDEETVRQRQKMYNLCKRETQEQIRLFSQLSNNHSFSDDFN